MIDRNLGNFERVARVLAAILLTLFVAAQPNVNVVEWFSLVVAVMLFLNGVFARCYLWYVLDINTCERNTA